MSTMPIPSASRSGGGNVLSSVPGGAGGVGAEVQQPRGLVVEELALRVPGHSQTVSAHCDAVAG